MILVILHLCSIYITAINFEGHTSYSLPPKMLSTCHLDYFGDKGISEARVTRKSQGMPTVLSSRVECSICYHPLQCKGWIDLTGGTSQTLTDHRGTHGHCFGGSQQEPRSTLRCHGFGSLLSTTVRGIGSKVSFFWEARALWDPHGPHVEGDVTESTKSRSWHGGWVSSGPVSS